MSCRRRLLLAASAGLAGCSPVRVLNALAPSSTYTFIGDQAYGPEPAQRFDVYVPTSSAPSKRPLVVFFYGGSWTSGQRADYRFVGEALASRGIVTVVSDYRLYPQASYPDFLRDCALALRHAWDRADEFGADPHRVFVMGHSAGAYNAAMLALDPRWMAANAERPAQLAGWVGLAGPYDFIPIVSPDIQAVFHHPNVAPDSQPIAHADARSIPCFLGAAVDDSYVDPQRNTAGLAARLTRGGTDVRVRWYPRVNHMTLAGAFARPLRFLAPVLDDTSNFIHSVGRA